METVTQPDYIDGQLTAAETKSGIAVASLRTPETTRQCTTTETLVEELRAYVNGPALRVYGTGTWGRDESGVWELQEFMIENFLPLQGDMTGKILAVDSVFLKALLENRDSVAPLYKGRIVIPTPALAEVLTRAGEAAPGHLQRINN